MPLLYAGGVTARGCAVLGRSGGGCREVPGGVEGEVDSGVVEHADLSGVVARDHRVRPDLTRAGDVHARRRTRCRQPGGEHLEVAGVVRVDQRDVHEHCRHRTWRNRRQTGQVDVTLRLHLHRRTQLARVDQAARGERYEQALGARRRAVPGEVSPAVDVSHMPFSAASPSSSVEFTTNTAAAYAGWGAASATGTNVADSAIANGFFMERLLVVAEGRAEPALCPIDRPFRSRRRNHIPALAPAAIALLISPTTSASTISRATLMPFRIARSVDEPWAMTHTPSPPSSIAPPYVSASNAV